MTLTTPAVEFDEMEAAASPDEVVETANVIAGEVKPIVLSAQARERLKVLNQVLEAAGPNDAAAAASATDGQIIDS